MIHFYISWLADIFLTQTRLKLASMYYGITWFESRNVFWNSKNCVSWWLVLVSLWAEHMLAISSAILARMRVLIISNKSPKKVQIKFSTPCNQLDTIILTPCNFSCFHAMMANCPFYKHGLTLFLAWISNHMESKTCDEITYRFPISCNVDVWEWISNFTWM